MGITIDDLELVSKTKKERNEEEHIGLMAIQVKSAQAQQGGGESQVTPSHAKSGNEPSVRLASATRLRYAHLFIYLFISQSPMM